MTSPILLVFCSPADRERVTRVLPDGTLSGYAFIANGMFTAGGASWQARALGDPSILLAIGAVGGAALARWVKEHGLDGVTGIGLVGVTAPWAERSQGRCPKHYHLCGDEACEPTEHRFPLGPLEPLRAVAERARHPLYRVEHGKPAEQVEHLRLVVACAPGDGVCAACKGRGAVRHEITIANTTAISGGPCSICSGTGKALSSADVANELMGPEHIESGGLFVNRHASTESLQEHGLRMVNEILTQ